MPVSIARNVDRVEVITSVQQRRRWSAEENTRRQRRGRRPAPEDELLAEIKATIAGQPTYGYCRIHALIRRQRRERRRGSTLSGSTG